VYSLLEVLTKGERAPAKTVHGIIETLIDHAQQGVYRPGARERQWVEHDSRKVGRNILSLATPTVGRTGRCFSGQRGIAGSFKEVALGDDPCTPIN
jgi:hypothetical protein